jgi:hypothetical protein
MFGEEETELFDCNEELSIYEDVARYDSFNCRNDIGVKILVKQQATTH